MTFGSSYIKLHNFTFLQEALEMASMFTDTPQLCMKMNLTNVQRFWVYSLFHLKIVEVGPTVFL
jgi:hypothetical protein